jgi:hypothetical protein
MVALATGASTTGLTPRQSTAGELRYGVQFPSESVTGDFLPPGEGALEAYTPPMYIVMVMRPSGDFSLNKMMGFLIAHLEIFSPGARVPRWIEVLKGVTRNVVTLCGYQYNLAGELVRVPREFYNDRYMAPLPVAIEDQKGNLLGLLRFLPWQDGGEFPASMRAPRRTQVLAPGDRRLKR